MTNLSKLLAFAMFAVGAAAISSVTPSQAHIARPPKSGAGVPEQQQCCTPDRRPILTNAATWSVKPPGGQMQPAVAVTNPVVSWSAPAGGAQWIANVATGSQLRPGGTYIYQTSFCLCFKPNGLVAPFPAAMSLSILADNAFVARLNYHTPFASGGNVSFQTPVTANVPTSDLDSGLNILEITVTNQPHSPTGLAVWGWVSGYFLQVPPGGHCPDD